MKEEIITINLKEIEFLINNKSIPAYSLEKETGVSRQVIGDYRNGKAKISNMTLKVAIELQKWLNNNPPKISYSYEELLSELKEDISTNLIKKTAWIERSKENLIFTSYKPIIDYSDYKINANFVEVDTVKVIAEMEKWNEIL